MVERWIVAPKAEGSSPSFYPLMLKTYNILSVKIKYTLHQNFTTNLHNTQLFLKFTKLSELAWQEGLFIDFLQKKLTDHWVKIFLIYSSYLFSERLVFETVVQFYLEKIIWPLHRLSVFEFSNVSGLLIINLVILISFFFLCAFLFLFYLMF